MERSMFSGVLDVAPRSVPQVVPGVGPADRLFMALLHGYRGRGGLQRLATLQAVRRNVWADEVVDRLPAGVSERRILGIDWNDELWVPDFQFRASGEVKPAASAVFLELLSTHDAWELAGWFIAPSTWLQLRRPIDLIERAPAGVLEAARADRYVATGS